MLIKSVDAPQFALPNAEFTGLAAPSRGASETAVWRFRLVPKADGTPHSLTREEIFVAVAGRCTATLDGERHEIGAGDALIVAAGKQLMLENPYDMPFEGIAVIPVGGQAIMAGHPPFTPPWAV